MISDVDKIVFAGQILATDHASNARILPFFEFCFPACPVVYPDVKLRVNPGQVFYGGSMVAASLNGIDIRNVHPLEWV